MPITLYTIGHSNHTIEAFTDLLHQHGITTLVDVRSQPYSQWASQFNRELLKHDLEEAGIRYAYMGDDLGGRPKKTPKLYPDGGERPDYKAMAATDSYKRGIVQLIALAQAQAVVVMCSEGDFHHCHRHLLITQTLLDEGICVIHIQPDGTARDAPREAEQLNLFEF